MQQILQVLEELNFVPLEQGRDFHQVEQEANIYALDPASTIIHVAEGVTLNLFLFNRDNRNTTVSLRLGRYAKVNLTHVLHDIASVKVYVAHAQEACSKVVALSLSHNYVTYEMLLNGQGASSEVDTLQAGSAMASNNLMIDMRHISPDCTSRSLSKCVASGTSSLKFKGLVYVAHDAQRTAAQQSCRGIELSDRSHIELQPQLEIYADDVKCSHGATMGQINQDAIFYMRQRGLSEAQARRLLLEGFIADVVNRCDNVRLREVLERCVAEKLERM